MSRLSSCSDDSWQQGVDAFNFLRVAMCDDVSSCVVLLEEGQEIIYTVDIYIWIHIYVYISSTNIYVCVSITLTLVFRFCFSRCGT